MSRKPRFDNYYFQNKERMRTVAKKRLETYKIEKLCITCGNSLDELRFVRCGSCRAKTKKYSMTKEQRFQRKLKVFEAYGGSTCACCKESNPMFLGIDHIHNNGAEHRRTMWKTPQKHIGGGNIYAWLCARKFPEGFQILCHNCNMGKQINGGICPHKG